MIRRALARLGKWIDSEAVKYYQATCYLAFVAAGVQALLLDPPSTISRVLGEQIDFVWTYMLVACPLLTLIGTWVMFKDVLGLWLRLAGDVGCAVTCWAYVAAIMSATWARTASYAAWTSAAIGVCILGVIARDIRLLLAVAKVAKRLDEEDDE